MKKNKFTLLTSSINYPLLTLLTAGLILRIILYFSFNPSLHLDEVLRYDAEGYHKLALQLLNHGTFRIPESDLDTFRTPGYPFFIYLIYLLFGVKPHLILAAQIFINLASVYVIYLIGKKLFNERTGLISAFLLCLEPDHIYYEYSVLSDTLFVLFLLLSFLSLICFLKDQKPIFLIASSLLTGTASLIKPVIIYFPAVIVFILLIYAISGKKFNIWGVLKNSILFIMLSLLPVSPWLIRNRSLYGNLKLTSFTGYNLLNYNAAFTIKKNDSRSIDEIRKDLDSLVLITGNPEMLNNPFYKSGIQAEIAADYIKGHKFDYFKAHLKGMINIYLSMDFKPHLHRYFKTLDYTESKRGNFDKLAVDIGRLKNMPPGHIMAGILYAIMLFLYYLTALYGGIWLFLEKRYDLLLSLLAIILYFTILTGIVGMVRYKLPISVFYLLLSGYFINIVSSRKSILKEH